jgi:hypothetical protein
LEYTKWWRYFPHKDSYPKAACNCEEL